jgi:hypothetical protein
MPLELKKVMPTRLCLLGLDERWLQVRIALRAQEVSRVCDPGPYGRGYCMTALWASVRLALSALECNIRILPEPSGVTPQCRR